MSKIQLRVNSNLPVQRLNMFKSQREKKKLDFITKLYTNERMTMPTMGRKKFYHIVLFCFVEYPLYKFFCPGLMSVLGGTK